MPSAFTITNSTAHRTLDADDYSLDELANAIATGISDWEAGTYDGSAWTISNSTEQPSYDYSDFSVDDLLNTFCSLIDASTAAALDTGYSATNLTTRFVLDLDDYSRQELAQVFGSWLAAIRATALPVMRDLRVDEQWPGWEVFRRRTNDYRVRLYNAGGASGIALAGTDVVRLKAYRKDNDTPALDLDSVSASSNGSVLTVIDRTAPASIALRIAQNDAAALSYRNYKAELAIVDDSESSPADAIKAAARGDLLVLGTGAGDVGKT